MPTYQGSCHCGAVRFSFEHPPIERGLRCNCSYCARKGALMTPEVIAREALRIEADDEVLGLYQFGSGVAKHYFCKQCGIYTFNETLRKPGFFRANLGCLEGVDTESLPADLFDGRHML
ncbi:GFA family protein [Aestuariirhabdus litorea]|uniref:GFA family protein n=1 Tax=Aestuariirhabdus litorea TaxID=2528527 RepID=A0A3P3VK06_9GAMM|nr:GFA family protein [Aestuariirhabdus litorea]RRJ83062.1 GFA family protein [Aestuariirhabdus litorea]RWW93220.1 GFA family protein [Endozoicomonadaceae bacterium GTF-13]